MKVKILGAHAIYSLDSKFLSVLVDDILALDAGSLASGPTLSEQKKVKAVLLSHSHLDHIQVIGALAMHLFTIGSTLEVYSIRETIDALLNHVFSGLIQPAFTKMPSPDKPTIRLHTLKSYKQQAIEGYIFLAVLTHHTIPSVGYQITAGDGKRLFYSSDTGPGLSTC